MNKTPIILSITIITIVFTYAMTILSDNNKCSWVRVFDCQKQEQKNLDSKEINSNF